MTGPSEAEALAQACTEVAKIAGLVMRDAAVLARIASVMARGKDSGKSLQRLRTYETNGQARAKEIGAVVALLDQSVPEDLRERRKRCREYAARDRRDHAEALERRQAVQDASNVIAFPVGDAS